MRRPRAPAAELYTEAVIRGLAGKLQAQSAAEANELRGHAPSHQGANGRRRGLIRGGATVAATASLARLRHLDPNGLGLAFRDRELRRAFEIAVLDGEGVLAGVEISFGYARFAFFALGGGDGHHVGTS